MKDEQIIALYFARNEDAIGETDKKYGARLLQLAQRILLDRFACEEVRSDTYLKTWNVIPPQRPPVFPAFLSRLTRQGAIDRYRRDGAQKRGGDGGLPGIGIGPGDEKPLHDRSSRSPSTSYISASSQKAQPLVVR